MQKDMFDMIAARERLRQQQRDLHQSHSSQASAPRKNPVAAAKEVTTVRPPVQDAEDLEDSLGKFPIYMPLGNIILKATKLHCPQPKCYEFMVRGISSSQQGKDLLVCCAPACGFACRLDDWPHLNFNILSGDFAHLQCSCTMLGVCVTGLGNGNIQLCCRALCGIRPQFERGKVSGLLAIDSGWKTCRRKFVHPIKALRPGELEILQESLEAPESEKATVPAEAPPLATPSGSLTSSDSLKENLEIDLDGIPRNGYKKHRGNAPGQMPEGFPRDNPNRIGKFESRYIVLSVLEDLEQNGEGIFYMTMDDDVLPVTEATLKLVMVRSLAAATGLTVNAVHAVLKRTTHSRAVFRSRDRLDNEGNVPCYGFRLPSKGRN